MNPDDTRHEARQHLIAYFAIGLFGALLVFMAHAYNREVQHELAANQVADKWAYQASQHYETIVQLEMQRDMLQAQLDELAAQTPAERIIVQPCVEPDPTPVFSRDSQFIH